MIIEESGFSNVDYRLLPSILRPTCGILGKMGKNQVTFLFFSVTNDLRWDSNGRDRTTLPDLTWT